MDLIVRTGKNSETYTLIRIIVDPGEGILFECLEQTNKIANKVVTVRPPRLIKWDATVEINPTYYDDSGNFGDALRKGIVE